MCTGAYDAGLAVAEQCYATLAARGAWLFAARAAMNAANILQRQGKIDEALAAFDRAEDACARAGEVATRDRLALMLNRALLQIVANRYRPAREALMHVYREALRAGYPVRAARAAVALANIHAALGRYNDALMLFDQAREVFAEEAMIHDVLVAQTDALDCALALNLHDRILEETAELIPQLKEANAPCELAQASYARGLALLARRRFLDARCALEQASAIFEQQGSSIWLGRTLLARARLQLRQRDSGGLALGLQAASLFRTLDLHVDAAQADLVVAEAHQLAGNADDSRTIAQNVLALARSEDLPWLSVAAAAILARLYEANNELEQARALYIEAIDAVERLREQVMFEYRASLLEDKEELYAASVRLSLALGDEHGALDLAERGRSRTLQDLLSGHVKVHLRPRNAADQTLVEQIEHLREEQSWYFTQVHRTPTDDTAPDPLQQQSLRRKLRDCETALMRLLERLYVRNADYIRDAAVLPGPAPSAGVRVPDGVVLVEYFVVGAETLAFVRQNEALTVVRNLASRHELEKLSRAWRLSVAAGSASPQARTLSALALHARRLLAHGYDRLVRPLEAHLEQAAHMMIVPHGPLHYLPFHAFFDGERYLIERYACSYLPAGQLLPFYASKAPAATTPSLVLGYSMEGRLPGALDEARQVAQLLGVVPELEADARRSYLDGGSRRPVIHIATHAEFREDVPIFSALCLADGPLTAADLFARNVPCDLLALSACDTGRLRVEGGDELVGLIRACLHAGADSVVLSQWKVGDDTAKELMLRFYSRLAAGETRVAALQHAQRSFLETEQAHPLHWAPFFLIGAWGTLALHPGQGQDVEVSRA
ncbi:MAG: CHAT domain-containing protein, partial [Chloroflexota bacterium]|nr:CHAT domain-containing protein [Chloroflexota bacterium]